MSIEKRRELDLFIHMIYELDKGVRVLSLLTTSSDNEEVIREKLDSSEYKYMIEHLNNKMINVYFGTANSIKVVESFKKAPLSHLSPEEDFILGVLLGYNTEKQCSRYLTRKSA